MRCDLHVHTVASDGAWTPEEVVSGAVQGRLDVIAVTDHDTTAGVGPARAAAAGRSLIVVPAVELSSTLDAREIHILGYFVDPDAPALVRHHTRARDLRQQRMERMLGHLRDLGVEVAMDRVLEAAGPGRSVLARPHLARALVEAGFAGSVPEAFDRYLADHGPAFVPTALQDPFRAVRVVHESGGVPVWAHPPHDLIDGILPRLVEAGLRGLEVHRPRARAEQVQGLVRRARDAGLFVTGGSDWHDPARNEPLGSFYVTEVEVGSLLQEGGL